VAARLIDPSSVREATNSGCCIQLRAPVTGRILRIMQENEAVVTAAAPLVDIGDPLDLEVVADLLSSRPPSRPIPRARRHRHAR
jgi:HlyD family secretion protein